MDSDPWASRIAAVRKHYSFHHLQKASQLDGLGMVDFEVEEEPRKDFLCPYCFEDHDVMSLRAHLEDEHPFESRVTVCPICSVKVTRDLVNHITMQHAHLFKVQRHQQYHRATIPSQAFSLSGRDLRKAQLQVLLANGGFSSISNDAQAAVTDSLISSLILNFPISEAEEISKPTPVTDDLPKKTVEHLKTRKSSFEQLLTHEEQEERIRQSQVRASFVQDLLCHALFGD